MIQNNIAIPSFLKTKADALKLEAKTVVFVSKDATVECVIAIADKIKPGAIQAIEHIKSLGIKVYMLTGDNEQTAKVIATQAGISDFKAEVMPADKGNFVKELQGEGKIVAMAGDGINDSNALAQADVGIAMGSGTDIAMESAGITLMNSDLKQISKAIDLSKATMKTIKQKLLNTTVV